MQKNDRRKGVIPLLKSLYLQDISIALGRRLKGVRYRNSKLTFEGAFEVKGESIERLNIEAISHLGNMTKIVIWEDAIAWLFYRFRTSQGTNQFQLHANLEAFTAEGVAQLIRVSLVNLGAVKEEWDAHRI